jgi:hypothetical protein
LEAYIGFSNTFEAARGWDSGTVGANVEEEDKFNILIADESRSKVDKTGSGVAHSPQTGSPLAIMPG